MDNFRCRKYKLGGGRPLECSAWSQNNKKTQCQWCGAPKTRPCHEQYRACSCNHTSATYWQEKEQQHRMTAAEIDLLISTGEQRPHLHLSFQLSHIWIKSLYMCLHWPDKKHAIHHDCPRLLRRQGWPSSIQRVVGMHIRPLGCARRSNYNSLASIS